jgi:hypothetical protein
VVPRVGATVPVRGPPGHLGRTVLSRAMAGVGSSRGIATDAGAVATRVPGRDHVHPAPPLHPPMRCAILPPAPPVLPFPRPVGSQERRERSLTPAAFPCLLSSNLSLPTPAENLCSGKMPPLCRLCSSPQLGMIVGIVPDVTPAAGAAAGREGHVTAVFAAGRHRAVDPRLTHRPAAPPSVHRVLRHQKSRYMRPCAARAASSFLTARSARSVARMPAFSRSQPASSAPGLAR